MKRIVIIGGGITGLAAAHRILERNRDSGKQLELTLLEAGSRIGGIVQTRERDDEAPRARISPDRNQ